MDKAELEFEWQLNSPEAKAEASAIEQALNEVGDAGDNAEKRLQAAIQKTTAAKREQIGIVERVQKKSFDMSKRESTLSEETQALFKKRQAEKDEFYRQSAEKIIEYENEINRLQKVGKQGFDDMGKAIPNFEKPVGQLNRLVYAQNLYAKAAASSVNPELIAKYNRKFQETEVRINQLKNVGKNGFDDMGNAISKNTNSLGKMGGALRFVASILPTASVAGLLAFAIEPFTSYLAKLDLFSEKIAQAVKDKKAFAQTMLEGAKNAQAEQVHLDQLYKAATNTNIPLKERNKIADELQNKYPTYFANLSNEQILAGKASVAYKNLSENILAAAQARAAQDKIADNAKRILENDEKIAEAEAKLIKERAALKQAKSYEKQVSASSASYGSTSNMVSVGEQLAIRSQIKDLQKTISDAQTDTDILTKRNTTLSNKIQDNIAKNGSSVILGLKTEASINKAAAKANEEALKHKQELQKQIDDFSTKFTIKSQSKDDAELAALDKQFKNKIDLVKKHNAKYRNAQVDGSGLANVLNTAKADLRYRQETEALKLSLEKQKQLYQDFEEYKLTFGETKAKERFKNEINVNSTYLAQLQASYAVTSAQNLMSGGRGTTSDRLKVLKADINAAEKSEKQRHDNLLKDLISYEEKRTILISNYQANHAELIKNGNTNEVTVLDKIHKEALGKLDDDNIQKLDAYKKLFLGIEDLSDKAAEKVIADARLMLRKLVENGSISVELAKQISDKLKDTTKALEARLPTKLKSLGGELKNIAGMVGDVDFGAWLTNIGDVVGGLGQAKEQLNELKNLKSGDVLGTISGGLGLFGTFMSIGNALGNLFNQAGKAQQENARYTSDMQLKQTEALTKALDRQLALIKEVYGIERVTKYTEAIGDISAATSKAKNDLSQLFALTGDKNIDDLLKKYNETLGKGWNGQDRVIFNKLWDSGQLGQYRIAVNDLTALQKLLDDGKLDEKAAALARTILDLAEKEREAANSIKEELTGAGFSDLADGIMSAITGGAEDGAKNFEDIMRKAMLNNLRSKELTSQIQKFYDDFASANKDSGLDDAKIAALRAQYEKIIADGKAAAANLEKVTGISLNEDVSSANSLKGAYKAASQESIDLLAGQTGGFRIAQLETNQLLKNNGVTAISQLEILKEQTLLQKEIEMNTKKTAENTDVIKEDIKNLNSTIQGVYQSLRSTGRI